MANQKLLIDIIANDKSKQALNGVQKGLAKVKQSVFNLRNAFIGLGAGIVLKGFVDAGIQVENLSVQLKTLFGSAQEGEKALRSITKFAAGTPFELKNIQQGVTSLAVVRKNAEKAGLSFDDLLTLTGNVAAQMGGDFALASFQIQKAFSAGIASAETLKERGVAGMAGFKAGVSVNAMDTIKLMNKAFGKGGEFGNLMEELSQTLFGTISNLKDAFFIFQVEVSKGFFDALKKNLGDLKKTVEANRKEIAEFGAMIGAGLSKAIESTASTLKFMKDNIGLLTEAFKIFLALKIVAFFHGIAVAIGVANTAMLGFNATVRKNLLIGSAVLVISQINQIIDGVKRLANIGKEEPLDAEDFLKDGQKMIEVIDMFGNKIKIAVTDLSKMEGIVIDTLPPIKEAETTLQKMLRHIKETIGKFGDLNKTSLEEAQNKFKNIKDTIAKGMNEGISKFSNGFARAVFLGEKLSDTFKKMAQELGVRILSALIEVLARKSAELLIEKLITKEKQKQQALTLTSGGGSIFSAIGSFFSGAKASGGAVSKGNPVLVGEQGPELFVPNQTGQITQNARGTNSGATTVNFNINTVDASGFEELLVRSRGTITQLINNAVNERGSKNLI
jgi:gas vesicle protein